VGPGLRLFFVQRVGHGEIIMFQLSAYRQKVQVRHVVKRIPRNMQYAVLCFPMYEYVCKLGGFSGSDSLEFRKGNSGAGKN